ncbi:hypothetical protein L249_2811 [Ophiocordyceps polyrhachis-furcata BCC 54312]|uniref:CHY-type domain-containing protein n=1 Tax=Ophiocordyceps polyrhachis-furcata BCC 54312 TaxID=1330021 RepID=A0A367LRX3_9HYPO|nr:hypothetical protein L249_2811 [Ophiocordyceps polyrhachis-furcata BCC 54312]
MIALKTNSDGSPRSRSQAVGEPSPSRIVPRPVTDSQAQDPRGYQLGQLRRRFSPEETADVDGGGDVELAFKLRPSDPDFPFELAYLDCRLRVPRCYPEERPQLRVANPHMPRGFAINIERGWDRLVGEREGATLLALVNALDRHLETFLSEQKADTVKLVNFNVTRHLQTKAQSTTDTTATATATTHGPPPTPKAEPKPSDGPGRSLVRETVYTKEQVAAAKQRRALEVRQLEARMGRLPGFRRSADGVVFTLPIEPKQRGELSSGLRSVCTLHLIVPLLYPLQHPRIQLNEADPVDAEPVEELFTQRAASQELLSLTGHINYLALNLSSLEKQARAASKAEAEAVKRVVPPRAASDEAPASDTRGPGAMKGSHVQVIPRPPEWTVDESGESSTDSSDDMTDEDEAEESIGMEGGTAREWPERGTLIQLPSVELHGIELLQIQSLSIRVKCDRCRTANEMTGLRPGLETTRSCSKCTAVLRAAFRPQLVHASSNRAGWVEVTGGKATELLPSTFAPTCSRCSTTSPGLVSVAGERVTNVCRECHGKFTLIVTEVRFLQPTAGTETETTSGTGAARRRAEAERLGLRVGEELPGRGACGHYRKSHRWFRFSCCGRVHACDRCHDEAEDHVNEWANRMICGWCSREQRYAVETCGFCGRYVVGR